MKLTPTKLSATVWTVTASLFVILAIVAGYALIFHHKPTSRDRACQEVQQSQKSNLPSAELTISDALCAGGSK